MKVAVATEGSMVAQHFGRCSAYTIAEVEDQRVLSKELVESPGHGNPGSLPTFLAEREAKCVICGGMGPTAEQLFNEKGIIPILGVSGSVDQALDDFVHDRLEGGANICER